jgi:hypothetical protein
MAVQVNGCVFVKSWICPVDGDEVPLEVCRLCVEARRTHFIHLRVKRPERAAEEVIVAPETSKLSLASFPYSQESFPPQSFQEELSRRLSELDRQFQNDEISLEEYVQRRKEMVEAAYMQS